MSKDAKSSETPSCLRVLHLSDFHFKLDRKWDIDPVLTGLAGSIRKIVEDDLAPDVVAFTGDIAHSGQKKEYEEAEKWIDEKLTKCSSNIRFTDKPNQVFTFIYNGKSTHNFINHYVCSVC